MPIHRPDPGFQRLRRVLLRQGEPDRLPFIELFADRQIMEAVIGEPIPDPKADTRGLREIALQRIIRFWYETGYDYMTLGARVELPHRQTPAGDTAPLPRAARQWVATRRFWEVSKSPGA